MNEIEIIQSKIYELRGQRVMLDFDLASLYQVETRVLNQAVKRNIERFPDDFMFQLTKGEWEILKSQIVTANPIENEEVKTLPSQIVTAKSIAKQRFQPYAFTENGVAMLSSVLRSPLAIQVNIGIMRAFVAFRHLATQPLPDSNAELRKEIQAIRDEMEEILADQNDINEMTSAQLDAISTALAELQSDKSRLAAKPRRPIGFNV